MTAAVLLLLSGAYECEGMNEIVEDNVSGFLVRFGDVESVVRKLTLLGENPELRRRMGEQSRRIVLERFSEEKCVDEMIGYYKVWTERIALNV